MTYEIDVPAWDHALEEGLSAAYRLPYLSSEEVEVRTRPIRPDPVFPMAAEYLALLAQFETKRDAHAAEHGAAGMIERHGLVRMWSCCGEIDHVFGEDVTAA